jgi:hypothetical protein
MIVNVQSPIQILATRSEKSHGLTTENHNLKERERINGLNGLEPCSSTATYVMESSQEASATCVNRPNTNIDLNPPEKGRIKTMAKALYNHKSTEHRLTHRKLNIT